MSSFDESALASPGLDQAGRAEEEHGFAEAPLAPLHKSADGPRMIIVEDAPLIALDLAETMREQGFDVRATAFTHEQALSEIEQSMPQFAIVDLHLGAGEKGLRAGEDLLALLHERGCRCLVFSGDDEACGRVADRYPHFSVLSKPAQPDVLVREIRRLRLQHAG